jgi:hypothetical protein
MGGTVAYRRPAEHIVLLPALRGEIQVEGLWPPYRRKIDQAGRRATEQGAGHCRPHLPHDDLGTLKQRDLTGEIDVFGLDQFETA